MLNIIIIQNNWFLFEYILRCNLFQILFLETIVQKKKSQELKFKKIYFK